MKQTRKIDSREFFFYVIPSILSFALAGVYSIVDGFFVGNSIGDYGLSAINIAYPIVAAVQAVGTGIGTGGAVYYSIYRAEKREDEARRFAAGAIWGLLAASVLLTVLVSALNRPLLRLLGAEG
ncbi:MAG TPA: multidrug transporter MatE, partial [Firmicutes bacterium]|nr:multidrug transporter MatE [Bacillota bacterium]